MLKITSADRYFSLCIRQRAGFVCERCGTFAPPELSKRLDCSHFHGRGKWSVRFDPENCTALCMGCHLYLTAHPVEHVEFIQSKLGPYRFQALAERAANTTIGRQAKREVKEVAKHFKAQLERVKSGQPLEGYL
jgi:hypothetical protein